MYVLAFGLRLLMFVLFDCKDFFQSKHRQLLTPFDEKLQPPISVACPDIIATVLTHI